MLRTFVRIRSNPPMLWLCLHFPELPLDAVRPETHVDGMPAALIEGPLRSPRVVMIDAAARAAGIRPGQSLAAARALLPALTAWRRDPVAELRLLTTLADWACRFSSEVSLAPPRALLIEIGSSLTLFGGWPAIERRLRSELHALGVNARLAVAPVAAGAQVLAVAGREGLVLLSGTQMSNELGRISVMDCGLEKEISCSLSSMGLTTLARVFGLPRAELGRRIGADALDRLDRLRGLVPEVRVCHRPAPRYERRLEFEQSVVAVTALLFPLQRLLREFARFLVLRDGGVQRFELVLEHERGVRTRISVGLLAPQQEAATLLELARGRLERIALVAPVEALTLLAEDLPLVVPAHRDLFETMRADALEWPALVERLRARLGDEAVHGLAGIAEHRPARAWRWTDPLSRCARARGNVMKTATRSLRRPDAGVPSTAPRPFWLLRRPIVLQDPVHILAGPERIESGWWDGVDQCSDYYLVRTRSGQRAWAWVARGATRGWMLHGWFA